jgi:UDP-N-acetylmuramate dehydrogenase
MKDKSDFLSEWLEINKIPYKKNYEIKYYSWIKAGGVIKNYIMPESIEQCVSLIKYLNINNIQFYIIGNQSNTIIRDGTILTPIINLSKMNKLSFTESETGINIYCESGVSIPRFSKNIIKKGFTGTEGLLGIPGSIGGAICMNASSYGNEVTTYLSSVRAIDERGNITDLKKEKLNLGWRNSLIKNKKLLILYAKFLIPKNKYIGEKLAKANSLKIMNHRKTFQENNLPNLGSIFATKNIYRDLSRKNLIFFILYIFYKLGNFYCYKFNNSKILSFRKFIINLYLKMLGLNNFEFWGTSDKTLNSLVNKGSQKSDKAISFLKKFKKKTNKYLEMENIILEDIH